MSWLWKGLAGALAVVSFIAWLLSVKNDKLERGKAKAEQRAKGEKAAREHIEDTVETTREVKDRNRRSTADERRDRLREQARPPDRSD